MSIVFLPSLIHFCHEIGSVEDAFGCDPLIARSRSSSFQRKKKKKECQTREGALPARPISQPFSSILVGKLYPVSSIGGCTTRATHMPCNQQRTMRTIDAPFAIHPHSNPVPEIIVLPMIDRDQRLLDPTSTNVLQPFLAVSRRASLSDHISSPPLSLSTGPRFASGYGG